jgi:hypothetical protein
MTDSQTKEHKLFCRLRYDTTIESVENTMRLIGLLWMNGRELRNESSLESDRRDDTNCHTGRTFYGSVAERDWKILKEIVTDPTVPAVVWTKQGMALAFSPWQHIIGDEYTIVLSSRIIDKLREVMNIKFPDKKSVLERFLKRLSAAEL